jgi:hypothetical protein
VIELMISSPFALLRGPAQKSPKEHKPHLSASLVCWDRTLDNRLLFDSVAVL